MAYSEGIRIKKKHGQHFLRDQSVIHAMIDKVQRTATTNVFEIGCGDGVLSRAIMGTPVQRLYIFEIDPEWATYVRSQIADKRMTMFETNFLDLDRAVLEPYAPWTVLANLPYNVTFPILHYFQRNRDLLSEGVVMVQEEVAQKLVGKRGRSYGFISLFFQHYFDLELMNKIAPGAFFPPPKVFSRLIYFKVRVGAPEIPQEERFWDFIKLCFKQPRRTLFNNLKSYSHYLSKVPENVLSLRAQQMGMEDFLAVWDIVR
jgi:16S rRNA (adenine1518-N6/adenine1519-N6)-dimethyltransferase